MRKYILPFLTFALLAMFCSVALAADADPIKTTVLSEVLTEVVKIVAAALMLVVGLLAKKGIAAFEEKTKIDVPAKEEDMVNKWVDEGVHFAEETAVHWIQAHASKPIGSAKMEAAFDFVWEQIQEAGLVGWTRDLVTAKINAAVNAKRANVVPAPLP